MKNKIYFVFISFFAFSIQMAEAQKPSRYLKGALDDSVSIKNHVKEMETKGKDTTYKKNIIPKIPLTFIHQKTATTSTLTTHFPYPIIMIHGVASSSDAWLSLYNYALTQGWSYGGTMNYCLNSDSNNMVANLTTDITDFTVGLTNSDFYLVNFNVEVDGMAYGNFGNNSVLSNEAAIYKQGVALKKAISHVLAISGKDKVIVLMHSMGGLATRQYIENPTLWQPDGKHHIAKYAAMGTPHGGSNMTGTWVLSPFIPLDEQSDALRDLRRNYFYSGNPGVFLHSGIEDYSVMDDSFFYNFYNDDVNCNGTSGDTIVGLNQKLISTDIDYSSVIGDWTFDLTGTGDGIVDVSDAQIKNFYPTLNSETFIVDQSHTALTALTQEEFLVIDEPDDLSLAYNIQKDTLYYGFITMQASDGLYITDYDQYRFQTQTTGYINITADNFYTLPYQINVVSSGGLIFSQTYSSYPIITPAISLPIGSYSLQISAMPSPVSWQYPYNYIINFTQSIATNLVEPTFINSIDISPNPTNSKLHLKAINKQNELTQICITDIIGKVVYSSSTADGLIDSIIDVYNFDNGLYFIQLKNNSSSYSTKFFKT